MMQFELSLLSQKKTGIAYYDITIYYMKLKEKDSYVFIITAFSDWR
jgi:hypothetical protein